MLHTTSIRVCSQLLELIKSLLHVVDLVLLLANAHATLARVLHAAAHFHAVCVAHLLEQVAHLVLVDCCRVNVVKRAVELFGLDIEVFEHFLKLADTCSNLRKNRIFQQIQ